MKPIVAIRPKPGLAATLAAGRAAGLAIDGWPLSEIRPLEWDAPPADSVDALLIGSANAIRHGGRALGGFADKPVHAVGEETAAAARAAGFIVAQVGKGGLQGLLDTLAGNRLALLRLAGAEHVPLAPPAGIRVETRIVYDSVALPMPEAMRATLAQGGVVLLHSAASARHFARECDRLDMARARIAIAALGPRIAAAAGEGWLEIAAAPAPTDAALLALAADMCH